MQEGQIIGCLKTGDDSLFSINPITAAGGGGTKCSQGRLFDAVSSVGKIQS